MHTEVLPFQRIYPTRKHLAKKNHFSELLLNPAILLYTMAFFISRISLAEGLIPFGIAFYVACAKSQINRILLCITILLGTLSSAASLNFTLFSLSMLLIVIFEKVFKLKDKKNITPLALFSLLSVVLPEILLQYHALFPVDTFIKAFLKGFAVFSLTFIFAAAIQPLKKSTPSKPISQEESLGLTITIILAIAGTPSLNFFGIDLTSILFYLLLLGIGYMEGVGAGTAAGVTMGLIAGISNGFSSILLTKFALGGLLAGILKPLGKFGTALGLIGAFTITTIYSASSDALIFVFPSQALEIFIAIFIFILIPKSFFEHFHQKFVSSPLRHWSEKSYANKMKELTTEKLYRFSSAFKEMSKTLGDVSIPLKNTGKQEMAALFDRVTDRVCKDCCLAGYCWDTNFYNTYQSTFKMLEKLDEKGRITLEDIPKSFLNKCERLPRFMETLNTVYEIHKVDRIWKNKLDVNQGLISKQLQGLSSMISDLAGELSENVKFQSELEETLMEKLSQHGMHVEDVMVYENKWGKTEVQMRHPACEDRKLYIENIVKLSSKYLEKKFTQTSYHPKDPLSSVDCMIKLIEEEKYAVLTGVARVGKGNNRISGDNYTFLKGSDGKYIAALSDGMGSGIAANRQSKTAIQLLEQFMESGLDKDTTLHLINAILALKTHEDQFASLDMTFVDLYTGEAEFVKVGAVPTFIKSGQQVRQIKSFSLPAGILANIEVEFLKQSLGDGDFIVMVSDGILDSFKKSDPNIYTYEHSLADFIAELDTLNPQEFAEAILNAASRHSQNSLPDDMTVIVSKLWQKM